MSAEPPVSSQEFTEDYYMESCGGSEFFKAFGPKVLKPPLAYALGRSELTEGMRILDIGCGRGEILYQARTRGVKAVGTDYAPAALKLAGEVSGAPVVLCDAKDLPFRDGIFDRIFFIGVIDHLHDWELEKCFSEMRRVLKPGGFVLVHTCTNRHYYKTLTYKARLALVRALGQAGIRLQEPSAPRSQEDETLHVNEHTCADLEAFFDKIGWDHDVEPMPNYKHLLHRLYGEKLPEGLPMRPFPTWKTRLFLGVFFHFPLDRILAREIFARVRPSSAECALTSLDV